MNNLNFSRKLAASPRAGCFPVLFLLAGLLTASAQTSAVFTSLYSFTGTNDGADPQGALVQGSDGNFYGTTSFGGTNYAGAVFKITANGAFTSLYSFSGGVDGQNPQGALVQGSDGYFYGTTEYGGSNGYGTVFKMSTDGMLTKLYSFGTVVLDPSGPLAGLTQGSDGYFYGTTLFGGTNNLGAVFKISTNGALTSLYSFTGGIDGAYPRSAMVQGSDGFFYGTTGGHGAFMDPSSVFKISTNGALTTLYTFSPPWFEYPSALVQGSDGSFYGTTQYGGTNNDGTVFKISTNGPPITLHSFSPSDGLNSDGGLMLGSDGSFYGTTSIGGETNFNPSTGGYGFGTVFNISTNGVFTSLYSFSGSNDGNSPWAGLVQGSDGSFYGTTQYGGTNNLGTVFRLTIEPQLTMTVSKAFITLSWPTNYAGWYLQKTVNLGAEGFVRITLQELPVIVNGQFVVSLPITSDHQGYYRLSLQ